MAAPPTEPGMLRQLQASLLKEQHHLVSERNEIQRLIQEVEALLHDVSIASLELFWLQQAHRKLCFQQCDVEATLKHCLKASEVSATPRAS